MKKAFQNGALHDLHQVGTKPNWFLLKKLRFLLAGDLALDAMSDEHLYARVVAELNASGPLPDLWAKAFAESNGNMSAAQALYLRLRVAQLQDIEDDLRNNYESSEIAKNADYKKPNNLSFSQYAYPIALAIVFISLLVVVIVVKL